MYGAHGGHEDNNKAAEEILSDGSRTPGTSPALRFGVSALGGTGRSNRLAFGLLVAALLLLALEAWGIRSSLNSLLR